MAEKGAQDVIKNMSAEFKTKSDAMLKEMQGGFNAQMEDVLKQYAGLQESFKGGFDGLNKQVQQANQGLMKEYWEQVKAVKEQTRKSYEAMAKQLEATHAKTIADFKTKGDELMKKFPQLDPKIMNEALNQVEVRHKQIVEENQKRINAMMEQIDKKAKQIADEINIPTVQLQNFAPVSTGNQNAGASGQHPTTSNKPKK